MTKRPTNRVPRNVLLSLVGLLLFTGGLISWVSNRSMRPAIASGTWLCDDLRTEGDELSTMEFSPLGGLNADPVASVRWSFDGKLMHIQAWRNDNDSPWLHWLRDTNLYGWTQGAETFPLTVQFNESKTEMTLSGPEGPRLRLYRSGSEPGAAK